MTTQSSEPSQALTEDETCDRDESSEARHFRENGLARANGFRKAITAAGTMPTHGRDSTRQQPEGNVSRDVSRAMVALFKEYVGRGPTHARAHVLDDLIVVVMRDTMIEAEKTLAEEGEETLVRGIRRVFQGKFGGEARAEVERLTGRRVVAFLSDHEVEQDVVIEAFVLDPVRNGR
jgi:uncharacterized protein YbcI